jgi:hypothetical protein
MPRGVYKRKTPLERVLQDRKERPAKRKAQLEPLHGADNLGPRMEDFSMDARFLLEGVPADIIQSPWVIRAVKILKMVAG